MTAGLREAMDDVRRSAAVLAARVWVPLGHNDWASLCDAEFGISRAQAYRLLDVARAPAAIQGAVAAGTEVSRTRDTGPAVVVRIRLRPVPARLDRRLQPQRRRRGG
ncbi:hypothetical protein [Streptomyces sp. NPDC002054]|uniref:hypothetical protein n=1 Tax=Streptomyces sp. NPDC002054 TaxID=3154663 RepID=UPI00331964F8